MLYEGLDWSVGVDGMFINTKQIPYTNCLYELSLACDSKSKQLKAKEKECEELKRDNINLKLILEKLKSREQLYMSALQNTKNKLDKMAKSIDTTPNTRDEEYCKKYYGDSEVENE